MSGKPSSVGERIMIAIGLLIFVLSSVTLIQAISAYEAGQTGSAIVSGIFSIIGFGLVLSTVVQFRKRKKFLLREIVKEGRSKIVCASCGFTVMRSFVVGDYIPKQVGQCQRCKGAMQISEICSTAPHGHQHAH